MRLSNFGDYLCYNNVVAVNASEKQRHYCLSVLCSACPFRESKGQGWKNVDVNIGIDMPLREEEIPI